MKNKVWNGKIEMLSMLSNNKTIRLKNKNKLIVKQVKKFNLKKAWKSERSSVQKETTF